MPSKFDPALADRRFCPEIDEQEPIIGWTIQEVTKHCGELMPLKAMMTIRPAGHI